MQLITNTIEISEILKLLFSNPRQEMRYYNIELNILITNKYNQCNFLISQ